MADRQQETPVKRAPATRKSRKVFGHPGKRAKAALRAGLYARVSTNDQQTLPMQNKAMREYAARRDWTVAIQVKEVGSGAAQRKMREQLIDAARRREIDVVLVWRLDRWGRSVADLLATLKAALVDREQLAVHQQSCNLVAAEELFRGAFWTDVRPLTAAWRVTRGLAADPLAALYASGYVERIAAERGSRSLAVSSYA